MTKKIIILICSVLFVLFIFGIVLGLFDFTRSKKLGKTNYYLVENVANVFSLYYQYPDSKEFFVEVLNTCVKYVYWDEQYILVTSYCNTQCDSIEEYYIVRMLPPTEKGVPWKKDGPMSKDEYERKKQSLHLNKKMEHIHIFD